MKKQVVLIHGGCAYRSNDDYVQDLKTREIDRDLFFTEREPRWKDLIQTRLGDGFEVAKPKMPSYENAKFEEWKIWFERLLPFLRDDVILIGHSLGAMFLAKYLSEHTLSIRIEKIFLVAPAIGADGLTGEDGGDFLPEPSKVHALTDRCTQVYLFHSEDDEIVPYSHAAKYMEAMPRAEFVSFTERGHFFQDDIPELIEYIK